MTANVATTVTATLVPALLNAYLLTTFRECSL